MGRQGKTGRVITNRERKARKMQRRYVVRNSPRGAFTRALDVEMRNIAGDLKAYYSPVISQQLLSDNSYLRFMPQGAGWAINTEPYVTVTQPTPYVSTSSGKPRTNW